MVVQIKVGCQFWNDVLEQRRTSGGWRRARGGAAYSRRWRQRPSSLYVAACPSSPAPATALPLPAPTAALAWQTSGGFALRVTSPLSGMCTKLDVCAACIQLLADREWLAAARVDFLIQQAAAADSAEDGNGAARRHCKSLLFVTMSSESVGSPFSCFAHFIDAFAGRSGNQAETTAAIAPT